MNNQSNDNRTHIIGHLRVDDIDSHIKYMKKAISELSDQVNDCPRLMTRGTPNVILQNLFMLKKSKQLKK